MRRLGPSRARGRALTCALGVLLAIAPDRVRADPPPSAARRDDATRVAVVGDADAPLTARLVAELRFLGFTPEVLTAIATPDPAALVELARDHGVAAAIAVDTTGGRVQVWIFDRMTGKLVARAFAQTEPGADAPRELAVRSVELLRASLLELEHGPTPAAEIDATPVARRTLRPAGPRLGVGAAIAVGGAPGGLPVAAHLRAFVRYMPHPHIGVVLAGTAPLHAMRIQATEGTARIHAGWLGVGPRVGLRRPDATFVPDLSAVIGPVFVGMEGLAAAGHVGTRALVVDAIVESAAGLEIALSPRVRLRLEAVAGVCTRTVRVIFSGRPVARWCRPHALGSVGIGVVGW